MGGFAWGDLAYLMLACTITTLPGLLGFVFPRKWVKKYMGIFLSIGIGCLLATVFLHIVPEMMEVSQGEIAAKALEDYRTYTLHGKKVAGGCDHDHSHDAHDHSGCCGGHGHSHGHDSAAWTPEMEVDSHGRPIGVKNPPKGASHFCDHSGNQKLGFAFIVGILIAFIMETYFCGHNHGDGSTCHDHGHRHSISCHTGEHHVHTADCGHSAIEMPNATSESADTKPSGEHVHTAGSEGDAATETDKAAFTSAVIFMLAAQMLHHFCDGVILGSLFAKIDMPMKRKMITTLAFFAHEFGQSISGYAVYINEGWSTGASVALVLLGYAPMFISAAAIFAVAASSKDIQHFFTLYCPPLATGFFLFIVLADMVPDVVHYHKETKWWNALAVILSLGVVAAMVILIPHEH